MEELPVKLMTWKAEMERKVLCMNMGKTKIMVSGFNLNPGKNPWRLSDRCRKKCRLLWWMLVLDPQEMQWNQIQLYWLPWKGASHRRKTSEGGSS